MIYDCVLDPTWKRLILFIKMIRLRHLRGKPRTSTFSPKGEKVKLSRAKVWNYGSFDSLIRHLIIY